MSRGAYHPGDFSDSDSMSELVKLFRGAMENGSLGGPPGGGMTSAAGMTYQNSSALNQRFLQDMVAMRDIRVAGLTSTLSRWVAGEAEAERLKKTGGMAAINHLTGLALNTPNGFGNYFGGNAMDAAFGIQSAVGSSFMSLGGRGFAGFGSGTNAATASILRDMQTRLFTAGGTMSRTGFNLGELGAITQHMGQRGSFRGMNLDIESVGGGKFDFREEDVKRFTDSVGNVAAKLRPLRDILGPGSSIADLIESVKIIGGSEVGKAGAMESFSRNLSSLRFTAAGANMDERRMLEMQNSTYQRFQSMGYGGNSTLAANLATQTALEIAARSGRTDLTGQVANVAMQQAAVVTSRGGQADMVKLAHIASVSGSAGEKAQAEAFLKAYAQNPDAAYSQYKGLMTTFDNIADRQGGLDEAYSNLSGSRKSAVEKLLASTLREQQGLFAKTARSKVDIGALEGNRADLELLGGAVASSEMARLVNSDGGYGDNNLTAEEKAAVDRLRRGRAGMDAGDVESIINNYTKAGGLPMANRASREAAASIALNKTGMILGQSPGRSGFDSFMAGLLGDSTLSDDEAVAAAARLAADGGTAGSAMDRQLLPMAMRGGKWNKAALDAAGVSEADLAGMSEKEQALFLQTALTNKGYSIGGKVVKDENGNYATTGDFVAMNSKATQAMQNNQKSIGLVQHMANLGFIDSKAASDYMAAAMQGVDLTSSVGASDLLSKMGKMGKIDKATEESFRAIVQGMSPVEREKLTKALGSSKLANVNGNAITVADFNRDMGMSNKDFGLKYGILNKNDAEDEEKLKEVRKKRDDMEAGQAERLRLFQAAGGGTGEKSFFGTLRLEGGNILIDVMQAMGSSFGAPGSSSATTPN